MKKLLSILLAFVLSVTVSIANASDLPETPSLTINYDLSETEQITPENGSTQHILPFSTGGNMGGQGDIP